MIYIGQARCGVLDVGIPEIGIIRPLSSATLEPKSRKSVQRYYFFLMCPNFFSFFYNMSANRWVFFAELVVNDNNSAQRLVYVNKF